jgi:hypothetical protein
MRQKETAEIPSLNMPIEREIALFKSGKFVWHFSLGSYIISVSGSLVLVYIYWKLILRSSSTNLVLSMLVNDH